MRGQGILLRSILVGTACFALVACGGKKKDDTKKDNAPAGKKAAAGDSPSKEKVAAPGDGASPTAQVSGLFSGMMGKKTGVALSKVDLGKIFEKSHAPAAPAPAIATADMKGAVPAAAVASDLWSLAPDNTAFGIVITDGTIATADRTLAEIKRIIMARPGGTKMLAEITSITSNKSGFDLFKMSSWLTTAGMDPSKGAALFMATNREALIVLPVVDPAAFQKAANDTKGSFGASHCVMASKGRYVCAEKLAYAKAAVASKDPPIKIKAASLPSWLKGDVQLVAHLGSFPKAITKLKKLEPALTNIGMIAVTARMRGGIVGVHGWLEGKRTGPIGTLVAALPQAKLPPLAFGAVNYFHSRIPMTLLTAKMPPRMPLPGGVDVRRDIFDNMTGEMLSFSRGKKIFAEHLLFGLKDPAIAAKAITALCQVLAQKTPPGVSGLRPGNGSCTATLDLAALLGKSGDLEPLVKGMPRQQLQLGIVGDKLLLVLGERGKVNKSGKTYGDPHLAKEFLAGDWNVFHWGMAFDPIAIAPPVLRKRLDAIIASGSANDRTAFDMMRWIYAHIYETGMGFALRDDGMYMVAQLTTMAADPPDVYHAHEAAFAKLLDGDYKSYTTDVMANAAKAPGSLAGQHARKMKEGVPILGQFGAVGALTLWATLVKGGDSSPRHRGSTASDPPFKAPARPAPAPAPFPLRGK